LKGRAVAYGAVSIVNAIATGRGAALGVGLKTEAEVELEPSGDRRMNFRFEGCSGGGGLAEATVREVLSRFGLEGFEVKVSTKSEIPVGKGLKSSSAASNAIALATLSALGKRLNGMDVVKLGVKASLKVGVTITGAFDDACASFFGGFAVTDNLRRKVLRLEPPPEDISVVIYVPEERMYTKDVDIGRLKPFRHVILEVFDLALRGRYWEALTLNGLIHSTAFGFTLEATVKALEAGALAAGLSGTGPAVAAVCSREGVDGVKAAWSGMSGEVLVTAVNSMRAYGEAVG